MFPDKWAGFQAPIPPEERHDMIAAYRTGTAGQAGITLLSLAYGANAARHASAVIVTQRRRMLDSGCA